LHIHSRGVYHPLSNIPWWFCKPWHLHLHRVLQEKFWCIWRAPYIASTSLLQNGRDITPKSRHNILHSYASWPI
jgi:hypothetical protein